MTKVKVHSVEIHWPVQVIKNPCSEIMLPSLHQVRPFTISRLRLDGITVTDWVEDGRCSASYVDIDEVYDPYK